MKVSDYPPLTPKKGLRIWVRPFDEWCRVIHIDDNGIVVNTDYGLTNIYTMDQWIKYTLNGVFSKSD